MEDSLLQRLADQEDNFIERKPEGANLSELRQTLVAFANSVPEGHTAVLFIGVSDNGKVTGVANPDSLQKKIRQVAEKDCYPHVDYQTRVLETEEGNVLAVLVSPSSKRPHFSGPAYVRKGSESVAASEEVYEELIASRNTKAGKILRNKGQLVTFRQLDRDQWMREKTRYEIECQIEGADAHTVDLLDIGRGRHFSLPLEKIRINKDHILRRMMIETIGD